MRTKKQKAFLVLKICGIVILLGIILLFAFRNTILEKVIHRIDAKMERDYQCDFTIAKAEFHGLTNLEFKQITLVPKQADTLVRIDQLKTSVNFWKLLIGDIQLGQLEINKGYVQLVKTKTGSNFDAFLRSKKEKTDNTEVNYAKLLNRLTSNLMDLVPTDMQVKGFAFRINDQGNKVVFDFTQLALAQKKLNTLIQVTADGFSQQWAINGFADPRDRKADLVFFNPKSDTIQLPYLDKKFNLKTGFQSIHFNLENLSMYSGELHIDGYSSIQNLRVNHAKIASKDVVIKNARFDYRWIIGPRFMALDSTSTVQLNNIKCHPYVSYTNETDKIYALKLAIPKMTANDFITSLPTGLFRHFEGMEAQGNFSYALNFEYNNHKPNDIIFESQLKPEGIKITKYGEADLNKINGEFTYRAIDNGVAQRPIVVGPSNPNFTPLNQISPYLQKCVLTSEDPSFFSHRGFINSAFKQSIVKNIKTKKFARGASTISMQLVKNAFLTREKTLSRKLEEILLVYILENNRISSKERMLEVYFNIIEWGPNVYGIGEASRFYFNKIPQDLNVNQCLFLAGIIPKPKGFMSRLENSEKFKPYAQQHNDFLMRLMFKRNLITANDTVGNFALDISGPAKMYLKQKPVNTIENDSLSLEEFDF
ncbi:transglycosylase domain-containing protein [Flavobacterium sp. J49]|uniref:transglycosylase domain-containing protein n=1 Tax=Flavobacterium sp. J49 TaxID=2718534 RepID=UPI0015933F03|nr:biosynthetic peptidoglycan transglycosylase [Flavobacterium sp. J49]MBF6641629.1 transglycosylase domain-containing protein [Flavobacterium sp. J49]NIC02876.1 transglycosylase domain-containing protein [Flavobacterium sp. J49]